MAVDYSLRWDSGTFGVSVKLGSFIHTSLS